ncbi:DUF1203 domain-containing protein [Novosphingobium sp. KN65.2]|uniref:DUF1203 domain-containing protein n=1 Tax=Novosphingobium sp. KN65.2 TaxID=1478134 RepID=UPI0005E4C502|nr:conserved hypothetical protein [Novosphingobium sp. KN65.2]
MAETAVELPAMTYRIMGLPRSSFAPYFSMDGQELARIGALRLVADADRGFPCRISLRDADRGESVLLLNFVSHPVDNPYRTTHAIFVRELAEECEPYVDCLPPVFDGRHLSLRGFAQGGMMVDALLVGPGKVEDGIDRLFANRDVACIHVHNAAYGCFAARIERHGADQ